MESPYSFIALIAAINDWFLETNMRKCKHLLWKVLVKRFAKMQHFIAASCHRRIAMFTKNLLNKALTVQRRLTAAKLSKKHYKKRIKSLFVSSKMYCMGLSFHPPLPPTPPPALKIPFETSSLPCIDFGSYVKVLELESSNRSWSRSGTLHFCT